MKEFTDKGKKIKIALTTAIVYILTMGIGMFIMKNMFNYTYNDPQMVKVIFFVEVILCGITIFSIQEFFSWKEIGFKKINLKKIGWFIPHIILMAMMVSLLFKNILLNFDNITTSQFMLIVIVGITTLLIGFSEEVMFRGILLHSFTNKGKIYTGFLVSAVLFSLLHSVNVFGGKPTPEILAQLVSTFILGLFFAPLAIKLNNIIPLIIYHWLWDFTIITNNVIGKNPGVLPIIPMILNLGIGLLLWINARKKNKSIN